MRRRIVLIVVALLVAGAGAGLAYWLTHRPGRTQELVIYGNVDLRQVELPFNDSERIAAVLVQEGDRVSKGQVLARLDTRRLQPQFAEAEAQMAAQQAVVEKLHNGSRPEEIAEARATVDAAKADATNARQQYERLRNLATISGGRAASQQDLDNARAALDVANAKVVADQKALDLEVAGPRREDIAQAEAQLQADQAHLALLQQQLSDAELVAPVDSVVRSRLMEPGEIASPLKPVFTLAVIDPKWVRAYVSEPDLGTIHPGEVASIAVDSFPNRRFAGWIGFISPVAEFTPKTVETEELRSSLVYEVRVFVKDASDDLRLGMPATVYLPLERGAVPPSGSAKDSRP
jgi:HlyD family secretion protein